MGFNINMAGKEELKSDFELIPEGYYLVQVEKCREDVTKLKQIPRLNLQIRIIKGKGGDESKKGRVLFYSIMKLKNEDGTDIANWVKIKIKNMMNAMGITENTVDVNTFTDKVAVVKVVHKYNDYKSETEAVIKTWSTPPTAQAASSPEPTSSPVEMEVVDDDDIPF